MNKSETLKKEDNIIEVVETPIKDTPVQTPQESISFDQGIAHYLAFLEAMRVTKKAIDTAPTLTPKNFYEQIQFYENGATHRIYIHINGSWYYVALT